jgi:flavodoxin
VSKLLVVYYSWSNGNTKKIAEELAATCHGDIAAIETAEPYEGSYDEVVRQAKQEADQGFEPALKPLAADITAYDAVAVGTPT